MKIPTPLMPMGYKSYAHELINKYFIDKDGPLRNNTPARTSMETEGDLEELQEIILEHNHAIYSNYTPKGTNLIKFLAVADSFDSLYQYSLISSKDAEQLGGYFEKIRNTYPALYQTAIIWAWS